MGIKRIGNQTIRFNSPPSVAATASVVGKKEGEGPLRAHFDHISEDSYFGEATWEKAESVMLKQCFNLVADKASIPPSDIQFLFTGDLLNQCVVSTFALRDSGIPHFGLYGACSTMAESLILGSMSIDGGFADTVAALTCSHFCTAERQYRLPLEYGGQRVPTAQWTVTGAGAVILRSEGSGPYILSATTGKIVDAGITDAGNMGAAMAPSAYETIKAHFEDTGRAPNYYDLIVTGDLGTLGHEIVSDLFRADGIDISACYGDCGMMIYDLEEQDVHCGASGCGCSASVLAAYLIPQMREGRWGRILFCATGALMSPTTAMQGESIPGICHAVELSLDRE